MIQYHLKAEQLLVHFWWKAMDRLLVELWWNFEQLWVEFWWRGLGEHFVDWRLLRKALLGSCAVASAEGSAAAVSMLLRLSFFHLPLSAVNSIVSVVPVFAASLSLLVQLLL